MTEDERLISDKLKVLQQITRMQLSCNRVMSRFKITDERGRDVLGRGWQDAHATLCHMDTVITFTMINMGFECWRDTAGGAQSANSKE